MCSTQGGELPQLKHYIIEYFKVPLAVVDRFQASFDFACGKALADAQGWLLAPAQRCKTSSMIEGPYV
jgi:hypothetical protein